MREVRRLNLQFGGRRQLLPLLDCQPHRLPADRSRFGEGDPESVLHRVLALPRRQLQDLQVLADSHLAAVRAAEFVVGHAEVAAGEQVLAKLVVLEGAGFADQRVDHVAVVDRVLAAAGQTRHRLHVGAGVPDLHLVGVDHDVHLIADQAAGDRIGVLLHLDRAAGVDFDARDPLPVVELARRQLAQAGLFLGELVGSPGVPFFQQLHQELFVLLAIGEVPAPAQQERLIDDRLPVAVRGLHVAVLMRLAGVGSLRLDLVVIHQVAVTRAELAVLRKVVDCRAEAIAAMPSRRAAQAPQCFLESAAERLERFREAHADELPI